MKSVNILTKGRGAETASLAVPTPGGKENVSFALPAGRVQATLSRNDTTGLFHWKLKNVLSGQAVLISLTKMQNYMLTGIAVT